MDRVSGLTVTNRPIPKLNWELVRTHDLAALRNGRITPQ